jgi:hypothetical protein
MYLKKPSLNFKKLTNFHNLNSLKIKGFTGFNHSKKQATYRNQKKKPTEIKTKNSPPRTDSAALLETAQMRKASTKKVDSLRM